MKTVIVYPVPMENAEVWELFKPFVKRFVNTYGQFDPGAEHELWVVLNKSDLSPPLIDVVSEFYKVKCHFLTYEGGGADIGSFQYFAKQAMPCFMVCCVTRVYFHREGWLARLVEARQTLGPGLVGTSASYEGGRFHLCTRCYAMDSDLFAGYPVVIDSRDLGTFFEIGRGNINGGLADWFLNVLKLPVSIWFFNGGLFFDPKVFPLVTENPLFKNGFRDGNQSNLLVWDKHSDAYAIASAEGKEYLNGLMTGKIVPVEIV